MHIKLSFMGAAQNVTGSRYLVEVNNLRFLVDCGYFQEREYRGRNWDTSVPPESVDAILLTHAHLDHSGLLPRLVRHGFDGPVFCTSATAEIAQIALMDAAKLLDEDAAFKKRRHEREGRMGPHPEMPLYTTDDAAACSPLFSPVRYGERVQIGQGVTATFRDAGHILGSSMVEIEVSQNGDKKSILFSGDVGRWDKPIVNDPTLFSEADYVLVESTYGNRIHEPAAAIGAKLADAINTTVEAGGNIVVPTFAIERAQELLYHLNELLIQDRIPHLMVFLDSPMAVSVTEVFRRQTELFDEETTDLVRQGNSPFDFPGLSMVRTVGESKAINHIKGSIMLMAGSGMCTGGRIKHHLVANISRPESTILFVGYQAFGTLGRQIVDGAENVRILGRHYPVRARIAQIDGFSAHADRNELVRWLSGLQRPPRHVFVVHGEFEAAHQFADFVRERTGWEASVPEYQEQVVLE